MSTLPPEILFIIASFARWNDLASFARVSTLFLELARQILYRFVMASDNQVVVHSLRNPKIARQVQHLAYLVPVSGSDLDICELISNMAKLRIITLLLGSEIPVFETSKDQEQFIRRITSSCPNLKEMQYVSGSLLPGDDFAIPNLVRVTWHGQGGFSKPLLSLCSTSSSTLTELFLTNALDKYSVDAFLAFTSLKFPRLESFQFGSWAKIADRKVPTSLTKFLVAHPTIKKLTLPVTTGGPQISLDINEMSANLLPELQVLAAHPEAIQKLVAVCADRLGRIDSLDIHLGNCEDSEAITTVISDMLKDCIQHTRSRGLPGLKNLTLNFNNEETSIAMTLNSKWMLDFPVVFPQLQEWTCDFGDAIVKGDFVDNLSKFPCLRVVDVKRWPPESPQRVGKILAASRLSDKCRLLQLIKFRDGEGNLVDEISLVHGSVDDTDQKDAGTKRWFNWVHIDEE